VNKRHYINILSLSTLSQHNVKLLSKEGFDLGGLYPGGLSYLDKNGVVTYSVFVRGGYARTPNPVW